MQLSAEVEKLKRMLHRTETQSKCEGGGSVRYVTVCVRVEKLKRMLHRTETQSKCEGEG